MKTMADRPLEQPYIRLDSSDPAGAGSDWTFAPSAPHLRLSCDGVGEPARLCSSGHVHREWPDPLDALAWMASSSANGQGWCG